MEINNDKTTTGVHARTPRLLLVDDEPMLQFTLRLMLEEFFEVVVADSGDQARLAIEAAPRFDVVLSDLQMPGALVRTCTSGPFRPTRSWRGASSS